MPIPKTLISLFASTAILLSLATSAVWSSAQNAPSPPQVSAPAPDVSPAVPHGVTVPAKNGLEMKAMINGQGPFDAILDTGSGNIITAALARRLGLKPDGGNTVVAGGGNLQVPGVTVNKVTIGGLVMSDQWFTVIDVPGQEGIAVGEALYRNLPIRVDFDKQEITFYDAKSFTYSGNGAAVPIRFQEEFLVAEGSVDGIPGLFGIDTGDMWSLALYAHFVAQHDLVKHYGAKFKGYTGSGFGGPDIGFYTRAKTLQLGAANVSLPITVLSIDAQGAEAAKTIAGNIGQHILRQFNLVFDFPRGKLYLEKSASYGKPDIFNRAGLVLDPDPDNLKVKLVVPGSPAAKAGLVEEDVITLINGRTPNEDTLVSAFAQPVGRVLTLTVRHGQLAHVVTLALTEVL